MACLSFEQLCKPKITRVELPGGHVNLRPLFVNEVRAAKDKENIMGYYLSCMLVDDDGKNLFTTEEEAQTLATNLSLPVYNLLLPKLKEVSGLQFDDEKKTETSPQPN